jgi:hypothetical protein
MDQRVLGLRTLTFTHETSLEIFYESSFVLLVQPIIIPLIDGLIIESRFKICIIILG